MPTATKNINAEKIQGNLSVTSVTGSFTGSLTGIASTASFVDPLNQNVLITGSLTVSSSNATQLQVGSNLLYVNNSNDVGIGTTSPSSYLAGTNGIAIVKPVYAGISLGTTSAGVNSNWLIYKMYNGQLSIYETTAARERFTISYTGEVGVGGPSTAARLIVMGAGSTSATTTFQVENSSAAKTIQCKDNQSIGFFGATTVTQPTTAGASSTFTSNPGVALNDADTYDGYTIAQVVKALRQLGLLA